MRSFAAAPARMSTLSPTRSPSASPSSSSSSTPSPSPPASDEREDDDDDDERSLRDLRLHEGSSSRPDNVTPYTQHSEPGSSSVRPSRLVPARAAAVSNVERSAGSVPPSQPPSHTSSRHYPPSYGYASPSRQAVSHHHHPRHSDSLFTPDAHLDDRRPLPSDAVDAQSASAAIALHNMSQATRRSSVEGTSRMRNGWRYQLVVVQHPERARMCGFGDKDRRPLSPSLIVKLVITEEATGEEVSPWDVNSSLFFLAADLCHPGDLMLAPRNLLVHQHATAVTPVLSANEPAPTGQALARDERSMAAVQEQSAPVPIVPATTRVPPPPPSHQDYAASSYAHPPYVATGGSSSSSSSATPAGTSVTGEQQTLYGRPTTVTMEHYTRNLVGAAVTSASVLRDEQEVYRIFFVLQDLSVRTEGVYRIRLVFTDLSQRDGATKEGVSDALAETYTAPFTVYSPRRFPGMLEPTELSKKLAGQGVKIAVRSDKKKRQRRGSAGGAEAAGGSTATGGVSAGGRAAEGEGDDVEGEED